MKTLACFLFFFFMQILPSVRSDNKIKCYECEWKTGRLVSGGNCLEPNEQDTSVVSNCRRCSFVAQRAPGGIPYTISRGCDKVPVDPATDTCDNPEKDKPCFCKGNLCNNKKVDAPPEAINCFECEGSSSLADGLDDDDSCFKPTEKTPSKLFCSQCNLHLEEKTDLFNIKRGCSHESISGNKWKNSTSRPESDYYCDDKNLCNNFSIEPPSFTTTTTPSADENNSDWGKESVVLMAILAWFYLGVY